MGVESLGCPLATVTFDSRVAGIVVVEDILWLDGVVVAAGVNSAVASSVKLTTRGTSDVDATLLKRLIF